MATVAQLVEHRFVVPVVAGSSPVGRPILPSVFLFRFRGHYILMTTHNTPDLWKESFPRPSVEGNKYTRGHCVAIAGPKLTGATRLVAEAAARVGAGLVTIIAPEEAAPVFRAACEPHIMIEEEIADRCSQLQDPRRNVLVLGPGFGRTESGILAWLSARGPQTLVLDADGLNAISSRPEGLKLLRRGDVLTPHTGEYKKLFGDITPQEAAAKTGCIVLLKGAETVITDGVRTVVNDHASPYLASAGTGDVLAGMIGGLIAQGMPAFDAVCAAVWMHGEAGIVIGAGLVASDIPDALPDIIQQIVGEIA